MKNENLENKYNLLLGILGANITNLKKASEIANRKAFWMKLVLVTLTTSITLILGLKIEFLPMSSQIALVISGLITILTTMDQFLGITSNHKVMYYRLQLVIRLRLDMELHLIGDQELSEEKWLEFKSRFDSIIEESNKMSSEAPSEKALEQTQNV